MNFIQLCFLVFGVASKGVPIFILFEGNVGGQIPSQFSQSLIDTQVRSQIQTSLKVGFVGPSTDRFSVNADF